MDLLVSLCLCTYVVFALVSGCGVWEVCPHSVDGDIGPTAACVVFWTIAGILNEDRETYKTTQRTTYNICPEVAFPFRSFRGVFIYLLHLLTHSVQYTFNWSKVSINI